MQTILLLKSAFLCVFRFFGLSSFDTVTTLILSRLASFHPFFEVIPEIYINFSKALYPVRVKYANLIVQHSFYFSWFYTRDTSPNSSEVTLTLALDKNNGVKSFRKDVYKVVIDNKLKVNIYNLTESSSHEDIQNALTTSWSYSSVVSRKGAKMEAEVLGSDDTDSYYFMDLGVIVLNEPVGYTYKISCNLPGCFGKAKGGIIHIKEDASGQYSVIKIDEF